MRLSVPASLIGTLGSLAQRAIAGVNALVTTLWGISYGTSFRTNTAITVNVSQQIFAPGSNPNGAILWRAGRTSANATGQSFHSLIAHTSAPNGAIVGDQLDINVSSSSIAGSFWQHSQLCVPIFIAAGKGLYWDSGVTETNAGGYALYTLF